MPHVIKGNGTGMNIAKVKPVRTRHLQTPVNDTMCRGTFSISIGNNIGKAGADNTFVYAKKSSMGQKFVQSGHPACNQFSC
jgi:hypothetical protein